MRRNAWLIVGALLIIFFLSAIHLSLQVKGIVEGYDEKPYPLIYHRFLPMRDWRVDSPEIKAKGALLALIDGGEKKLLFEKEADTPLPIASITKLMTVLIALEEYSLDDLVTISEEAFLKDSDRINRLYTGERYSVRELIYASLIESSNTASEALSELDPLFIEKMNQKSLSLGMKKTHFSNATGLDPDDETTKANLSSPKDLLLLAEYLLRKPFIWDVLLTENHQLVTADGRVKHTLVNTNKLLDQEGMKGGKTGNTLLAGSNFLSVFEDERGIMVTILLASPSRFEETLGLINWSKEGYYWKR